MSTISTRRQNLADISANQRNYTSGAEASKAPSGTKVPISQVPEGGVSTLRFAVGPNTNLYRPNTSFSSSVTKNYNLAPEAMAVASKKVEILKEVPEKVRNIFKRVVDRLFSSYKKENLSLFEPSLNLTKKEGSKVNFQKEGQAKSFVNPLNEEILPPSNQISDVPENSLLRSHQKEGLDQRSFKNIFAQDLSSRNKSSFTLPQEPVVAGFVEATPTAKSPLTSLEETSEQNNLFSQAGTTGGEAKETVEKSLYSSFSKGEAVGQQPSSIAKSVMSSQNKAFAYNLQPIPSTPGVDTEAAAKVASSLEAQKRASEEERKRVSDASEMERLNEIHALTPPKNGKEQGTDIESEYDSGYEEGEGDEED